MLTRSDHIRYNRCVSKRTVLSPPVTRSKFGRWVSHKGGQSAAALILGCSRSYLSLILSGNRGVPYGSEICQAIEINAGIPMIDWLVPASPNVKVSRRRGAA